MSLLIENLEGNKMKKNEKQITSYIEKVISEAAAAENHENDVQYQYLLIDNDLLFAIKSKYQRVRRRIEYRLLHNLERNFGLCFNLVYPDKPFENIDCFKASHYSIYDQTNGITPNNSFMEWTCFGRKVTVTSVYGIRPDNELGMAHLNRLKENGYDFTVGSSEQKWELFKEAYERAYGETPMDGFRKMKKFYESQQ